jgi:hypothetical protein
MAGKRKPNGAPERPSAALIARLAGVSIARVNALRQQGRDDADIITTSRQFALRGLPAVPIPITNGHAAAHGVPYSESLAKKEESLAELRRIEVMERRRELLPVSYFRLWATKFLTEGRDILLAGPSELQDALAAESDPLKVNIILRNWVGRVMERLSRIETAWTGPEAA